MRPERRWTNSRKIWIDVNLGPPHTPPQKTAPAIPTGLSEDRSGASKTFRRRQQHHRRLPLRVPDPPPGGRFLIHPSTGEGGFRCFGPSPVVFHVPSSGFAAIIEGSGIVPVWGENSASGHEMWYCLRCRAHEVSGSTRLSLAVGFRTKTPQAWFLRTRNDRGRWSCDSSYWPWP